MIGLLNLSQLISDFEACIGFPYASPGTNDERGIDCSGMFVRAFRRQGASIYHGSNTIFRKYLARSGMIASAAGLRPGMAVFKWKPVTPARFSDGLGDFCHIGLVTSVSPLRIVHASTEGMAVKADSKIGKWRYWGWLKDVAETSSINSAGDSAVSTPSSVSRPTLRTGSRGDSVRLLQTLLNRAGYDLAVDGIFGTMTWCSVKGFQSERGLQVDGIVVGGAGRRRHMSESLLVALISGFCTLAGSCAGVLASSRLTQYRLAQLEKRVAQHNNLIERTYRLEGRMDEAEHGLQEIRGRMAA